MTDLGEHSTRELLYELATRMELAAGAATGGDRPFWTEMSHLALTCRYALHHLPTNMLNRRPADVDLP